ncbi:MAG TPA: hypothetical protein P5277_04695 [Candidatus Paceibacterota bacterium]|nr:hypothetical protein [Candidatus Paceibacterota bacterium]
MRSEKRIKLFLIVAVLLSFVSFVYSGDFFALQGNVKQNGVSLNSGNLTVYIFDDYSGGNLIYNSSSDFSNAILNGKYDVLLGNGSQELNLDYGRKYYFEIYINDERLNFTGNTTRQVFQSSVGNISSMYINFTTGISLPAGQNVSLGLGGWFKGLFNWVISNESRDYLTFNGSELNLTVNVTRWMYNQTAAISGITLINSTVLDISNITNFLYNYNQTSSAIEILNTTYGVYWYNQTYSGSTYNATYALWAYNQTVSGGGYNITYDSWLGNYTEYNKYWYNMTGSASVYDYNHTSAVEGLYGMYFYNMSDGSYNATYDKWAYNQTGISVWNSSGSNTFLTDESHNVGIGTSTPSMKLDVIGSANFSGNIYVNGSAEFGGGWQNNGVTISEGKVFAQTGYFYNITSLSVNNLNVNASIYPGDGFDNQFDLGNSTNRWRYGYFGTDVLIGGNSVNQWMYNQTTASLAQGNNTYVPYTGAITNVDLGNHSFETSGILTVGQDYAAQSVPVKLLVNGTSLFNKNLYASDYYESVGSVLSIGFGNVFTTNVYEASSNPNSFVTGLKISTKTPSSLGSLSGLRLYGISADIDVGIGTAVDYVNALSSDLTIEGNVSSVASSIYIDASDVTGNVNDIRGIFIGDFSKETLEGGGATIGTNSYAIYSGGGDVYFEDVNNFTIYNGSNTASLCLNGICYQTLTATSYNVTYEIYSYNMTDGSYNGSYIPYTGANQSIDFANNNFTVGSNTFFVNPITGQVGIGTDYINDTYMLRVAGSVLIDGNLTFLGNSSQLQIQGLSSNGSIIPEYHDTYDIGNDSSEWRYGYFSREISVGDVNVSQWLYNQTQAANASMFDVYGDYWYNQTYSGSIYNETYALWAYNQTIPAINSLNSTYAKWWYNQSIGINISMVNAYGKWWYNQTELSLWNISSTNLFPKSLSYKVGIGTITPTHSLNVVGDTNITGTIYTTGLTMRGSVIDTNDSIHLKTPTAGNGILISENQIVMYDGNPFVGVRYGSQNLRFGNSTNNFMIMNGTTGHFSIGNSLVSPVNNSSYNLQVAGNASINNTFYVTNDGKVGIGTSSPFSKLHIYSGSSLITPSSQADGLIIEDTADYYSGINILGKDSGREFIYFGSESLAVGSSISWNYTSNEFRIASVNANANVSIRSGKSVESIKIDSLGKVGIGTSTPTQKLEVAGNVNISGSYSNLTMGRGRMWWDDAEGRLVIQVS